MCRGDNRVFFWLSWGPTGFYDTSHCFGCLALGFLAVLVIVRKIREGTKEFGGQKIISDLKNNLCTQQSQSWFSSSVGHGWAVLGLWPLCSLVSRARRWAGARALGRCPCCGAGDARRQQLRTWRPAELPFPLRRSGSAPWFPCEKKFLQLSQCISLNWNWESHLCFSVSTQDRDRQYKSKPKTHLVGRAKGRQSKGKGKIASAFKFSYMTLMFEPRTLLYFDVYSQAGVSAAFLYSFGCQGMWASCLDSIIFILPKTSPLFGNLLDL